jgi:hypothetical protein
MLKTDYKRPAECQSACKIDPLSASIGRERGVALGCDLTAFSVDPRRGRLFARSGPGRLDPTAASAPQTLSDPIMVYPVLFTHPVAFEYARRPLTNPAEILGQAVDLIVMPRPREAK